MSKTKSSSTENITTTIDDKSLNDISLEYSYEELKKATNNFSIATRVGKGSYGDVYKGILQDGNEVAIKYLHANQQTAGFEEEVKVLSKFRHQNLVILMGFARHDSQRLLVYELLPGGDVGSRLQKGPILHWRQRISIALDAACGLSHLHNQTPKVFHRDIKSANILLDRNGSAKWGDFGLACFSANMSHKVNRTAGTVGYADPKYISSSTVTEHTEVYSFGWVIIELLTGKPPAWQLPGGQISYFSNQLRDTPNGPPTLLQLKKFVDQVAGFPDKVFEDLGTLALKCINPDETIRPSFRIIVVELRALCTTCDSLISSLNKPVSNQNRTMLSLDRPNNRPWLSVPQHSMSRVAQQYCEDGKLSGQARILSPTICSQSSNGPFSLSRTRSTWKSTAVPGNRLMGDFAVAPAPPRALLLSNPETVSSKNIIIREGSLLHCKGKPFLSAASDQFSHNTSPIFMMSPSVLHSPKLKEATTFNWGGASPQTFYKNVSLLVHSNNNNNPMASNNESTSQHPELLQLHEHHLETTVSQKISTTHNDHQDIHLKSITTDPTNILNKDGETNSNRDNDISSHPLKTTNPPLETKCATGETEHLASHTTTEEQQQQHCEGLHNCQTVVTSEEHANLKPEQKSNTKSIIKPIDKPSISTTKKLKPKKKKTVDKTVLLQEDVIKTENNNNINCTMGEPENIIKNNENVLNDDIKLKSPSLDMLPDVIRVRSKKKSKKDIIDEDSKIEKTDDKQQQPKRQKKKKHLEESVEHQENNNLFNKTSKESDSTTTTEREIILNLRSTQSTLSSNNKLDFENHKEEKDGNLEVVDDIINPNDEFLYKQHFTNNKKLNESIYIPPSSTTHNLPLKKKGSSLESFATKNENSSAQLISTNDDDDDDDDSIKFLMSSKSSSLMNHYDEIKTDDVSLFITKEQSIPTPVFGYYKTGDEHYISSLSSRASSSASFEKFWSFDKKMDVLGQQHSKNSLKKECYKNIKNRASFDCTIEQLQREIDLIEAETLLLSKELNETCVDPINQKNLSLNKKNNFSFSSLHPITAANEKEINKKCDSLRRQNYLRNGSSSSSSSICSSKILQCKSRFKNPQSSLYRLKSSSSSHHSLKTSSSDHSENEKNNSFSIGYKHQNNQQQIFLKQDTFENNQNEVSLKQTTSSILVPTVSPITGQFQDDINNNKQDFSLTSSIKDYFYQDGKTSIDFNTSPQSYGQYGNNFKKPMSGESFNFFNDFLQGSQTPLTQQNQNGIKETFLDVSIPPINFNLPNSSSSSFPMMSISPSSSPFSNNDLLAFPPTPLIPSLTKTTLNGKTQQFNNNISLSIDEYHQISHQQPSSLMSCTDLSHPLARAQIADKSSPIF